MIEYAFGTIDRAVTMVGRDANGGYHISRLSYYDTADGKAGIARFSTRPIPPAQQPACISRANDRRARRPGKVPVLPCDQSAHRERFDRPRDRRTARSAASAVTGQGVTISSPSKPVSRTLQSLTPRASPRKFVTSKKCIDCHILPKDFRDREPENTGWVRSQGVGWARSRCNTESGGRFGCVTCHNPHQSARAASTAAYEAKCVNCHVSAGATTGKVFSDSTATAGASPSFRACPVNATEGCINCHMPKVRVDSLHMDLTDHHIRVHPRK